MLKSFIVSSLCFVLFVLSSTFQVSASTHRVIPVIDDQIEVNLSFYEAKEGRCLDAFARSDFEVAYAICTPLANLGFKDAQLVTGLLYAYGEGVDKNLHRAKIWLQEALKNGREDAAQALSEFGMD